MRNTNDTHSDPVASGPSDALRPENPQATPHDVTPDDAAADREIGDDTDAEADDEDWKKEWGPMVLGHDAAEPAAQHHEPEVVSAVDYEFGIEGSREMEELSQLRERVPYGFVLLVCEAYRVNPAHLTYGGIDGQYPAGVRTTLRTESIAIEPQGAGAILSVLMVALRNRFRLLRIGRRIRKFYQKDRDTAEADQLRREVRETLASFSIDAFGAGLDERVRSAASLIERGAFGKDPAQKNDLYRYSPKKTRQALALARRIEAFLKVIETTRRVEPPKNRSSQYR